MITLDHALNGFAALSNLWANPSASIRFAAIERAHAFRYRQHERPPTECRYLRPHREPDDSSSHTGRCAGRAPDSTRPALPCVDFPLVLVTPGQGPTHGGAHRILFSRPQRVSQLRRADVENTMTKCCPTYHKVRAHWADRLLRET